MAPASSTHSTDEGLQRQRRAKALADPTRYRVYETVATAPDGIDVADLAARFGLHHTAIRQHLRTLLAAGLVQEEAPAPAAHRGRGRPPVRYRATAEGRPPEQPYVDLARLLTRAVRTGRTARQVGREVGREVGRAAAAQAIGPAPDSAAVIAGEERRYGFSPSIRRSPTGPDGPGLWDDVDIVLGACPFADVADDDPATVCALHLGLAEGVSEELGDHRAVTLVPADPHAGGCRLTLRAAR